MMRREIRGVYFVRVPVTERGEGGRGETGSGVRAR